MIVCIIDRASNKFMLFSIAKISKKNIYSRYVLSTHLEMTKTILKSSKTIEEYLPIYKQIKRYEHRN